VTFRWIPGRLGNKFFKWKNESAVDYFSTFAEFYVTRSSCQFVCPSAKLAFPIVSFFHCRYPRQFPLAESARVCAVQAGADRLSLAERHGSIIPGGRPATFVRHAVKTTSAVLTDTPAGCPPVAVRNSGQAFAVASARNSNRLPPDIVACNTLSQFCRELKTFLFTQSCLSVLLSWFALLSVFLAVFLLRPR